MSRMKKFGIAAATIFLLTSFLATAVLAEPVAEGDVRTAALTWAAHGDKFDEPIGTAIREVKLYRGGISGNIGYYLVMFEPSGFAVLPADDELWPIPLFGGGQMTPERFEKSPWFLKLSYSRSSEDSAAAGGRGFQLKQGVERQENRSLWQDLLAYGDRPETATGRAANESRVNLIRVAPLLKNEAGWHQFGPFQPTSQLLVERSKNSGQEAIWNWHPETGMFSLSNLQDTFQPGCTTVATGQAISHMLADRNLYPASTADKIQLKRKPTDALQQSTNESDFYNFRLYKIWNTHNNSGTAVGGETIFGLPLGGTPSGNNGERKYNWTEIHNAVSASGAQHFADAQKVRNYVTPLLRDLGVMFGLGYNGTAQEDTTQGLTGGFYNVGTLKAIGFDNAVRYRTPQFSHISPESRKKIMIPNLELGMPVPVAVNEVSTGLQGTGAAHAYVVDGYGYNTLLPGVEFDETTALPYYHGSTNAGKEGSGNLVDMTNVSVWIKEGETYQTPPVFEGSINDPGMAMTNEEVLCNLIADAANFVPAEGRTIQNPVFLSGRIIGSPDPTMLTLTVTYGPGANESITVTPNSYGRYTCVVPANKDYTVSLDQYPEVPGYSDNSGENVSNADEPHMGGPIDPGQVDANIANRYDLDFNLTPDFLVLPSAYDNLTEVLDALGMTSYHVISKELLLDPEYTLPKAKVFFIASDPDFSHENQASYPDHVKEKITSWVNGGGALYVTGKSSMFLDYFSTGTGLEWENQTLTFNSPVIINNSSPHTRVIANTFAPGFGSIFGGDNYYSWSAFEHKNQSVIAYPGEMPYLTKAPYLFLEQYVSGGSLLHRTAAYWCWTGVDFFVAANGGRIIYVNQEMDQNVWYDQIAQNFYLQLLMSAYNYSGYPGSQSATPARATTEGQEVDVFADARRNARELPRGIQGDTFYYLTGDGRKILQDGSVRILALGSSFTPENIDVLRVGDDLVVGQKNTLESVIMPNWFSGGNSVAEVRFGNGTSFDSSRLRQDAVEAGPEIDITPFETDEHIHGTDGDDALTGTDANQRFQGGPGDDRITGNGGKNVYHYEMGDGNDTLVVNKARDGDVNVLMLGMGVKMEDVSVEASGEDLLIHVGEGCIRVENWFTGPSRQLDYMVVFDAGIIQPTDLLNAEDRGESLPRRYYLDTSAVKERRAQEDSRASGGGSGSSGGCRTGAASLFALLIVSACAARGRKIFR